MKNSAKCHETRVFKGYERLSCDGYALSGSVELIPMPLDHKLYEFEGIRSIIDFIASINSSKNIFGAGFGENLLVFLYKSRFSFVNQKP